MDNGEVECVRGECREVRAAVVVVVAPLEVVALVVMVRGEECEGEAAAVVLDWVGCDDETLGVGLPCCCKAECARKAERKEERKGWFEGILGGGDRSGGMRLRPFVFSWSVWL